MPTLGRTVSSRRRRAGVEAPTRPVFRRLLCPCSVFVAALALITSASDASPQTVSVGDTLAAAARAQEAATHVSVAGYFVGAAVTTPLLLGAMLAVGRGDAPPPLNAVGAAGFFGIVGWAGGRDVALEPVADIVDDMEPFQAELFVRNYTEAVKSRRSKALVHGSIVGVIASILLITTLDD